MINKIKFRLQKNGEPYFDCYCRHPELIENYDLAMADNTQTWDVHHRKESLYSQKELKERGEYFDVPPEDLIFLTIAEHRKLDSYCKRNSKAHKGQKPVNRKKVLCVETGQVFSSAMEVSRQTGINRSHISEVCNGKLKTSGGYHWRYL